MKKINLIILIFSLSISCSQDNLSDKYAESITSQELTYLVYEFASDEFEGRNTGEAGQKRAVNFIKNFYKSNDIVKADNTEDYFQKFLVDFSGRQVANPSDIDSLENLSTAEKINWVKTENVAAIIEGSEYPDEYIILTAHLDHVGIEDGEIYNGADDDGSG